MEKLIFDLLIRRKRKRRGLTGSGVYVLHVDPKNGSVSSVAVEKSTGHQILDNAAVTTFSNLRFKPHGVLRVKIPVTFTMPQQTSSTPVTHNFPATWLAVPQQVRVTSGPAAGRR
jgi:TonB family protein